NGLSGVNPERFHDVAEVNPARFHENLDLFGFGIAANRLVEGKIGENARLLDLESIGQDTAVVQDRVAGAGRKVIGFHAMDPADIPSVAPESDFMLALDLPDLGDEIFDLVSAYRGIKINLRPAIIRLFIIRDAKESSERCRGETGKHSLGLHRHGAPGQE